MSKKIIDWDKLRLEFITDPNQPSVSVFFREKKLMSKTCLNRVSQENWRDLRGKHWESVTAQAAPVIAGMQAAVFARDVAQKLTWIDEVKTIGLELIKRINLETANVGYGEVVQALERLEKLERLILGESTENIKVEDARAMVESIIDAVLEEVRDDADRSRLLDRLESIGSKGTNRAGSLN